MDSRAKCVLGAVIYVAVLFVVMFAWNRIFPNGFSADEMIASLTAAFIAYISGVQLQTRRANKIDFEGIPD